MTKKPTHLIFSFLPLLLASNNAIAQSWDTVVSNAAYQSYFSYTYREPVMVVYKLFHGGGNCERACFRQDDIPIPTATDTDYRYSVYDRGHMANAKDFAFDCDKEELTFRYYNCVPQTQSLNRGKYEKWEKAIRGESQSDSLLIICGNIFGAHPERIGKDSIAVPVNCYKVVESLSSHKILHVLVFTNQTPATCDTTESEPELEKTLGYRLPLERTW
jgi:endonuclease G